jgi:hypothetical protein
VMIAVENQAQGVDQGPVKIEKNSAECWHHLKIT